MCKKNKGLHNRIDPCMKNFILRMEEVFRRLNKYNKKIKGEIEFEIKGSCCGHLRYPMTLVVSFKERVNSYDKEKTELFFDFISGKGIPRSRKFYKKDKDGYYFIPECIN